MIAKIKSHYKKWLNTYILWLQCIWLKELGTQFLNATIRNCWRKAGFGAQGSTEEGAVVMPLPAVRVGAEQFENWILIVDGVNVVKDFPHEYLPAKLASKIRDKEEEIEISDRVGCEKDDEELETATTSAAKL